MKYDLKKPCANCPLLVSEERVNLRSARIMEIHNYLTAAQGGSFPCHKTAAHDDDGEYTPKPDESHCAGGLIYALAQESPNQLTRVALRLGVLDADALLKHRDLVFPSVGAWLKHAVDAEDYERERDETVPCSAVFDGCYAPAGYIGADGIEDGIESAEYTCDGCGEPVCGNPRCSSLINPNRRLCAFCWEWED